MNQIVENLKDLGPKRLAMLGGIGFVIVAAILIGARTIFAPTYVPVYSQLSPGTASQMMQTLEQAGLTVDLSRNGDTISVAEDDIARARMALADAGLPGEGVPGWEIFDEMSGMGMNSFMQKVNRLRALEGELARSIQTISGIKAARVHLVLPERAAFSRSQSEASGSVIVRAQANASITRRQAQAIQALVASAVADLEAQNVTVLSGTGETILAKDDGGSSDYSLQGQRSMIEEQLAQKVESILNARVGPGNTRVRVSVDLTTEREVRVSRSFDPAQQVARSIETRTRNANETDPANGNVDVGNNIPDELRDDEGGGAAGQSTRSENDEIINYEIGSVQSELVREPGDIERISVAVLVNGSYGTLPDGSEGYIERSEEEMQRLTQLVSTAIGFDQTRGDQVQVDSLQFLDFDSEFNSPMGRGLGAVLADNAMTILRSLFGLALVAIIMLFGARPLRMVLDATAPQPALAGAGADAALLAGGSEKPETRALSDQSRPATQQNRLPTPAVPQNGSVLAPMDEMPREMVQLASVDGALQHSQIRTVTELAQNSPDDALRVLGDWLAEEASALISTLKLRNFDEDPNGTGRVADPDQPTPEEIEAKIKKAHKQGHIEGYLAGADAGRAEMHKTMQAEHAEMAEKLAQELARLATSTQAHHDALVAQVVGFTLQTCEIVLPEVIERLSTERVKKTVTQSLKMAIGSSRIKVRLSPTTLEQIGPELYKRATYYKCDGALDVQADPAIADGDARMEWDHGSLDYGFKKICDRLLAELRETHRRAVEAQKEKDGHG